MINKIKSGVFALKKYGVRKCIKGICSILISDVCVVSFQKSGRTWLRTMLAKYFAKKYGNKELKLDTEFLTFLKGDPNVFFTHAGGTRNKNPINFANLLKRKKIIFLIRNPRDVVVSLYHDLTKRNFLFKGSMSEFIKSEWGIDKIISFMNYWGKEMRKRKDDFLILRFEDMKEDTGRELKRVLNFLGLPYDNATIKEIVKFGSFENMRKIEKEGKVNDWRLKPVNIKDENSFKTRKGKVGSYKEELKKEDIDFLNKKIKENLLEDFNYYL